MQLLVAGTLLVAGLQWLGSTTDIVELLLNGVALAYIMEIDELTYNVLVPTKVATLIRRMEPMDVNWPMELPLRSLLMTVPLTITLTIFMVNVLQPHAQAVSEVQQALCA
uniref:H(+)-exporting diphosphatase n=1 Tax=Noctiluca scintillans TaxID=2966 RepID=A0A7S1AD67_NOCSC